MATMPVVHTSVNGASNGVVPAPTSTMDAIQGQIWSLSPAVARELLAHALPNRRLVPSRVTALAAEMSAGAWAVNGETIILDAELRLVDGQHRCAAVIQSGCTVQAFVVVGVQSDVMGTIDQGRSKTAADVVAMAGLEQAPLLASAGRWLWKYENRSMRSSSVVLKNYELPAFIARHSALSASLSWGRSLRNLMPPSCASMLFYLLSAKDAALAKAFFGALDTGAELRPTDAAHVIRERFLRTKEALKHGVVVNRAAVIVLGWNTLREARPCSPTLSWRGLSDKAAPFPTVL